MEQQPRLPIWFVTANCALIIAAFALGVWLGARNQVTLPEPQGSALGLIHAEIMKSHVEQQDGQALLDLAIQAMVKSLDDYSRYVAPSQVTHYEEVTTGRYEGVGMVMQQHGEDIVVHFPFAGGPAEQAGIRPGDRVVAVDDQRLAELPIPDRNARASELLRGPEGSDVDLLLDRDGEQVGVTLTRSAVQRPVLKWAHLADPENGLGYLYVENFYQGLAEQVDEAIAALERTGPLRGLVVDLRGNGGGSLDECVAFCRRLQGQGVIVATRRRGAVLEQVDADPEQCRHPDLPLVVLVNEDSASASEVFAGCLQDHGRAAIVGAHTFGKGVVNTVYSWREFKLKLTTAYYYTPKGRSLGGPHREADGGEPNGTRPGIQPDDEVPLAEEERHAVEARLFRLEVPPAHRAAFAAMAERYGVPVPAPPRAAEDPQLARALEVLAERVAAAEGR